MQAIARIVKNVILVEEIERKHSAKRTKDVCYSTTKYINNIQDNTALAGKILHKVIKMFLFPPTNVTYNEFYNSSQWVGKSMNHINTIMHIVLFRTLWYKTNNFSNFNCFNTKSSSEIWICRILFCFFEETNYFTLCACNLCKSFCSSCKNERKRADTYCKLLRLYQFSKRIAFEFNLRQINKWFSLFYFLEILLVARIYNLYSISRLFLK